MHQQQEVRTIHNMHNMNYLSNNGFSTSIGYFILCTKEHILDPKPTVVDLNFSYSHFILTKK